MPGTTTSGSVSRSPSGAWTPWFASNSFGQASASPNSLWAIADRLSPAFTVTVPPWAAPPAGPVCGVPAGAGAGAAGPGVAWSGLASAGMASFQPGWIGRSASKRTPESSITRPSLSLAISVQRSPEPSWRSAMDHRLSAGRLSRTV